MRNTLMALTAVAAMAAGGALVTGPAQAMNLSAPAAMHEAVDGSSLAQDVRLVCRTTWWRGRPHRTCYESRPWRGGYRDRHRGYRRW